MKLNVISKTALAVTLLISQATYDNNSNGYYEDDSDFAQVSSVFGGGWGWGLNSAKAGCSDASEFSCMTIVADPWPEYDPTGGYDPYPEIPEDTYSGSTGSGGGSGTTPTETNNEPELTGLQECNLEALERKNSCYTVADVLFQTSVIGCVYLGTTTGPVAGPVVAATCAAVATLAYNDQKNTCDYNYQKDLYICEQTFS